MKNERTKNILLAVLLVAVVTLTIAYAVLSATLTINTTAIVQGGSNNWKVEFVKTATEADAAHMTCVASGNAEVTTQPTINSTSFTGLVATFKAPGDSVVCKWNVENNGSIDAYLKTFTAPGTLSYEGTGTSKTSDEAAVNGKIQYSLTYDPSGVITGETSSTGDALNHSQDRGLILTITYDANATTLPVNDVTVTGINYTFLYEQK